LRARHSQRESVGSHSRLHCESCAMGGSIREVLASGSCRSRAGLKPAPTNLSIGALPRERGSCRVQGRDARAPACPAQVRRAGFGRPIFLRSSCCASISRR
jgi:hypothetical protein